MNVRASERGVSDDGVLRVLREDRMKRASVDEYGGNISPSQDVIHMNKGADVS